jgi:hypothetical protein
MTKRSKAFSVPKKRDNQGYIYKAQLQDGKVVPDFPYDEPIGIATRRPDLGGLIELNIARGVTRALFIEEPPVARATRPKHTQRAKRLSRTPSR